MPFRFLHRRGRFITGKGRYSIEREIGKNSTSGAKREGVLLRCKRAIAGALIASVAVVGVGVLPATAVPDARHSSLAPQTAGQGLAENGGASGPHALSVESMKVDAGRETARESGKPQARNPVTTALKAAIKVLLREGGPALGKALSKVSGAAGKAVTKYSHRIADFLDTLAEWQEGPIIVGLVKIGIPVEVARDIAFWIVTFVGL